MARNKSKNVLAMDAYGEDFDDLTGGEKAAITKKYNAQTSRSAPVRSGAGIISATVGRVGDNGTDTCLLEKGSTVEDLISQSKFDFDSSKEGVVKQSTGRPVSLSSPVVHNETYAITVEIKSA